MKKLAVVVALFFAASVLFASGSGEKTGDPVPIKVLLLPKIEIGEMSGDTPGEAQLY